MAEDRDTEARWYVVHTYSGYENKVAQNLETIVENRRLQELIHEVKVPVELVPDIKDGKEREVERKLFPGYVLVKMVMTDDSWYIVRNTRGVTGFVGPSSKPIPLTDEEVDKLGVDVREVSLDYAVGDNVQIMNGPLEGFIGIVEGIDTDAKKVNVKVSMFGRAHYNDKHESPRTLHIEATSSPYGFPWIFAGNRQSGELPYGSGVRTRNTTTNHTLPDRLQAARP